jgi:hypothetical protein
MLYTDCYFRVTMYMLTFIVCIFFVCHFLTEYFFAQLLLCMIQGQCVTLYSFQVFYNEIFNDSLPLNCGDGSTRKIITVRLTDVIVYEFEHVIVTCIMVRDGRRHQRAGPPCVLSQNTTILMKLLCLQDLSPRLKDCML